jgi:hypothetical protein
MVQGLVVCILVVKNPLRELQIDRALVAARQYDKLAHVRTATRNGVDGVHHG